MSREWHGIFLFGLFFFSRAVSSHEEAIEAIECQENSIVCAPTTSSTTTTTILTTTKTTTTTCLHRGAIECQENGSVLFGSVGRE